MNLKSLAKMLKLLSLILLVFISSSCETVKDFESCTVAGSLDAGAICAHSNYDATRDMSFSEFMSYLEPTSERPGAVCVSFKDYANIKLELETMCRMLGDRCSYEVKQYLQKEGLLE